MTSVGCSRIAAISRLTMPQAISPIRNTVNTDDSPRLHGLVWQIRLHQALQIQLLVQRLVARGLQFRQRDAQLLIGKVRIRRSGARNPVRGPEGAVRAGHFGSFGRDRIRSVSARLSSPISADCWATASGAARARPRSTQLFLDLGDAFELDRGLLVRCEHRVLAAVFEQRHGGGVALSVAILTSSSAKRIRSWRLRSFSVLTRRSLICSS